MSRVISLRLRDETAERLRQTARRAGRAVNEMSNIALEEWLRQGEFTDIEFQSFNGERHACVKGGPQVWQVIEVARRYGMDIGRTAAHFEWQEARAQAAFSYYEAYPEEVDLAIDDNQAMTFDQLKRLLPGIRRVQAPGSDTAEGTDE